MSEKNPNTKKRNYNNPNDPRRKSPQDYHDLAQSMGIEWLGTETFNGHTPTRWRCCSCGHEWTATYSHIKSGTRCPKCVVKRLAKNRAFPEGDYQKLAIEKGILWVGTYPEHTEKKTLWQCEKGHTWETTYRSLTRTNGNGCPECAGNLRKEAEDYHKLALEKGFEWLDDIVVNAITKTRWKCSKGHVFESTYSSLVAGHGCRECLLVPLEEQARKKRLGKRRWRAQNYERYLEQSREYNQRNPHLKILASHKRRMIVKSLPYEFTKDDYNRMMEYWGGACAISGETKNLHIDHWIPVTSSNCPGTIPENMIPLAGRLNMSKQDKDAETWLVQEFGREKADEVLAKVQAYFDWLKTL